VRKTFFVQAPQCVARTDKRVRLVSHDRARGKDEPSHAETLIIKRLFAEKRWLRRQAGDAPVYTS
jgi:hypothetical protein